MVKFADILQDYFQMLSWAGLAQLQYRFYTQKHFLSHVHMPQMRIKQNNFSCVWTRHTLYWIATLYDPARNL